MKASVPYKDIILGKKAAVSIEINNTEDMIRYTTASCVFVNPNSAKTTNSSSCITLLPFLRVNITAYVTADILGSWSVESCSLQESSNMNCSQSWQGDTKSNIGSFTVSAEKLTNLVGAAVVSQQLNVGEKQTANIVIRNTGNITARAYANCTFADPDGNEYYAATQQQDIAAQSNSASSVSLTVDKEGMWSLDSCSVVRVLGNSLIKEDEKMISSTFEVVKIECTKNSDCDGSTISCSCVENKCKPCDYGYVCRSNACAAERPPSEDCLGTQSSCYKSGTRCVACPENSVCTNSQCVPVNNEPVPSMPMFTIIIILLVVLTPFIVFLVYRFVILRR
jgi:hypothetical protein